MTLFNNERILWYISNENPRIIKIVVPTIHDLPYDDCIHNKDPCSSPYLSLDFDVLS